jgi:hypothetical protein
MQISHPPLSNQKNTQAHKLPNILFSKLKACAYFSIDSIVISHDILTNAARGNKFFLIQSASIYASSKQSLYSRVTRDYIASTVPASALALLAARLRFLPPPTLDREESFFLKLLLNSFVVVVAGISAEWA